MRKKKFAKPLAIIIVAIVAIGLVVGSVITTEYLLNSSYGVAGTGIADATDNPSEDTSEISFGKSSQGVKVFLGNEENKVVEIGKAGKDFLGEASRALWDVITGEEDKEETKEPEPKDSKKDETKKEAAAVEEKPPKKIQEQLDSATPVEPEQTSTQTANTQALVPKTGGSFLYNAVASWAAPVYQAPDDKAKVLKNLKKGETVQIYGDFTSSTDGSPYKIIKYKNQYGYIPYYSVDRAETIYGEQKVDSRSINNPYEFVSLEGNIRKGSFEDLMRSYTSLPQYVRSMFQNEGYIIRMTEQDVQYESFGPQGYTAGGQMFACFDYETKRLYVNDEDARHIVHEMGHYVNDRLGMFSNRPENKSVFSSEKEKISLYASISSAAEFYAECFDLYFRCNDILRQQSPVACEMIERSLTEFRNLALTKLPAELCG